MKYALIFLISCSSAVASADTDTRILNELKLMRCGADCVLVEPPGPPTLEEYFATQEAEKKAQYEAAGIPYVPPPLTAEERRTKRAERCQRTGDCTIRAGETVP